MEIVQHIKDFALKNKTAAFALFLALGALLFLLAGGNQSIKHLLSYQQFFDGFAAAVAESTAFLLRFTGMQIEYVASSKAYNVGTPILLSINTTYALRYFVFVFVILLLLPDKSLKSFFFFLLSAILLFAALVFRNFFEILYYGDRIQAISQLGVVARPVVVLLALAFKFKNSPLLQNIYNKLNESFRNRFLVSIYPFVFVIAIAEPLAGVFEVFNLDFIANAIQYQTQMLANIMGEHTHISGRYIYLEQFWVYVGDPCLGIGVSMIFAFLIATLRGQTLNKIIFIAIGLYTLLLMNAVRVWYILLDLRTLQSAAIGYDAHEMSNYFFYIVVFILLNVYMFWFDSIDFNKFFKQIFTKKPRK